jgi:hypothetical protein
MYIYSYIGRREIFWTSIEFIHPPPRTGDAHATGRSEGTPRPISLSYYLRGEYVYIYTYFRLRASWPWLFCESSRPGDCKWKSQVVLHTMQ